MNRRSFNKKQQPRSYVEPQPNSSDPNSSLPLLPPLSASSAAALHPSLPTNVDPVLYEDLVDVVSLVESLIDRQPNSTFKRRSSVIYTKAPAKDLSKKTPDAKGKYASKVSGKNQGDLTEKDTKDCENQAEGGDGSTLSRSSERDREELLAMKEQVDDLQRKLLEKDELLKAAENSKDQLSRLQADYDDLRRHAAEKESLIQTRELDLSDVKIKLADKQAALEKAQWEAMTSHQKVGKLQEEIETLQTQMSSFTMLFEELSKDNSFVPSEDYEILPYCMDPIPGIDGVDDESMSELEAATEAYLAAVVAAKEKQDEESLQAAANARLHLQSFVF